MRSRAIILAAALFTQPLDAEAADLVVWWDEGSYPQEAGAVVEVVAAFEQGSGKQVQLVFQPFELHPKKILAALEDGSPPDFAYGHDNTAYISEWAFEDRLKDLSEAVGFFSNLFDSDALDRVTLLNQKTGEKALYALPIGRSTNHIHVWKNLLASAGFTLDDIPRKWEPFWSFWCDEVQPAVREATGRDDVWGLGVPMTVDTFETWLNLRHFMRVYDADYVTPDGRLIIDGPEVRQRLVTALDRYTELYRKGCTPPDAITWDPYGNNEAFLTRRAVMTINETLSVVNALKAARPEDYRENTATIEWPLGLRGEAFPIGGSVFSAVVFKGGDNVATAKEFILFLVREGWLAHYLNFSGERMLPSMSKLLDQPFWLDPNDRHRMAAVMQVGTRPLLHQYAAASGNWRHDVVEQRDVWETAVHRAATGELTPELARIKQVFSE